MKPKILIVDDSPISRRIIKSCLPPAQDHDIYEAVNGKDGLEKFKELSPDVTFLDLTMPVMGGGECLEKIMKVNPKARVIVVTADIQPKSITKIMELGAFRMIRKPPNKEVLQRALMDAQSNTEE